MYKSTLPARNNEIEEYNNTLNIAVGIYFSANANRTMTENPAATKVKYKFFRRFIRSLGIIISLLYADFTAQANRSLNNRTYHGTLLDRRPSVSRKAYYGQFIIKPFVALQNDSLDIANNQYVLNLMSANFPLSSSVKVLSILSFDIGEVKGRYL